MVLLTTNASLLVVADADANGGELALTIKRFGCILSASLVYFICKQICNKVIGFAHALHSFRSQCVRITETHSLNDTKTKISFFKCNFPFVWMFFFRINNLQMVFPHFILLTHQCAQSDCGFVTNSNIYISMYNSVEDGVEERIKFT